MDATDFWIDINSFRIMNWILCYLFIFFSDELKSTSYSGDNTRLDKWTENHKGKKHVASMSESNDI